MRKTLINRLYGLAFSRNARAEELEGLAKFKLTEAGLDEFLSRLGLSDERKSLEKDAWHGRRLQKALWANPGSYNSPIVNVDEVDHDGSDNPVLHEIPGVPLDLERQREVWAEWVKAEAGRWKQPNPDRRYHPNNSMFGGASARLLAMALCAIKPARYIEIGSGFSSAVVLDCNDEFFSDRPIQCTFIDPYPERLKSILRPSDASTARILEKPVQSVDTGIYGELQDGDILFIDSSHVMKSGSDLYHEIFKIIPALNKGVYIHFHDIFFPFDYPSKWLKEQNRSWNEAYFLRSFLMYNSSFETYFWTDFFTLFGEADLRATGFPELIRCRASSIWLRRV